MNNHLNNACRFCLIIPVFALTIAILPSRADVPEDGWSVHGQTHKEQRFSPLDQINRGNVDALQPEWYLDIPSIDDGLAATRLSGTVSSI